MPELPEVEGVVRDLKPLVEGKTIESVTLSEVIFAWHANGKQSIVKGSQLNDFQTMVHDMTITNVERRAKYIFIHLEKNNETFVLVNHLGMTGAWFVVDAGGQGLVYIMEGIWHYLSEGEMIEIKNSSDEDENQSDTELYCCELVIVICF